MNKRLERLHKAAFKHHNDGKAEITQGTSSAFVELVIVDRDMEGLTPSGDIQSNETHIQVLHLGRLTNGYQGIIIRLLDTGDCFRCDRKVSDDGYVIRLAVTPLFTDDSEVISDEEGQLSNVIHRSW